MRHRLSVPLLDSKLTRAYSFGSHVEGLRMLSLLSVLLLQRDRVAVRRQDERIARN